jgi:hypothetical protein
MENTRIFVGQRLYDDLTVPSKRRKRDSQISTQPKSILEAKDKAFRKNPIMLRSLDLCGHITHACFFELIKIDLSDTIHPNGKPALHNCRWAAVKSALLDKVRTQAGLCYPDPIPRGFLNGTIQVIAEGLSPQYTLCVSQPMVSPIISGGKSKDPMTRHLQFGVGEFMLMLTTMLRPTVHYYHDVKDSSYIPINRHCDTIIELAKRGPDPSSDLDLKEANAILWKRYENWHFTLREILKLVTTIDYGKTVTIRHSDRLFPTPSPDPNHRFRFSTCFAERLASLVYFDPTKTTHRWVTSDPLEMESACQGEAQRRVEKMDESALFENMVEKIKKVVKVDNSGGWDCCPCCWKEVQ